MKFIEQKCFLFTTLALLNLTVTIADETAKAAKVQQADIKQIDAWVDQLGHKRLTKRIQAKKKLINAGKTAIPSLAKAALSDKRESIERSIDILGTLAQSKEETTSDAARVTLEMLSESKKPSTAARAKLALDSKEAEGIKPFQGWDDPGNQFARGGQNRSISVSNINGVRTIKVIENGRETLIEEAPRRGIRVTIKTGEKKPVVITAKNTADLKKRSPEAFAAYQQYTSGNGNGVGAFGIGNGGFIINNAQNSAANQRMVEQLKQLKNRMAGNPMMQQLLDQQIKSLSKQNGIK